MIGIILSTYPRQLCYQTRAGVLPFCLFRAAQGKEVGVPRNELAEFLGFPW